MKRWVTEIMVISPTTGSITKYCGPYVPGLTIQQARQYCEENGLGYCKVIGELVTEVPAIPGTNPARLE